MIEWQTFVEEVQHIEVEPLTLPQILWLSATEGDKNKNLSRLDHWPEDVEAVEGVWRDYYTGEKLENYTKPWDTDKEDNNEGPSSNCVRYFPGFPTVASWQERPCIGSYMGCPCTYEQRPILHLRGFCSATYLENTYTPMQLSADPTDIIMVGQSFSKIMYDSSPQKPKWFIRQELSGVEAWTDASHMSYALGKQTWTVQDDNAECRENAYMPIYQVEMKLTGCEEGEFTCDDGQCVKMAQRCNQLTNCRDKSDERGCKILILDQSYNKRIPPITPASLIKDSVKPVTVSISLTLLQVVAIEEEEHAIELQFEITLEWKENRATYFSFKE